MLEGTATTRKAMTIEQNFEDCTVTVCNLNDDDACQSGIAGDSFNLQVGSLTAYLDAEYKLTFSSGQIFNRLHAGTYFPSFLHSFFSGDCT